mmetsp:Transcript_16758/g.52392  ORF Transcript_16758/g.52392 Transcript_16758/m.52392 type:complete len:223 (-) Transcript_16758:165-833(-)
MDDESDSSSFSYSSSRTGTADREDASGAGEWQAAGHRPPVAVVAPTAACHGRYPPGRTGSPSLSLSTPPPPDSDDSLDHTFDTSLSSTMKRLRLSPPGEGSLASRLGHVLVLDGQQTVGYHTTPGVPGFSAAAAVHSPGYHGAPLGTSVLLSDVLPLSTQLGVLRAQLASRLAREFTLYSLNLETLSDFQTIQSVLEVGSSERVVRLVAMPLAVSYDADDEE